MATYSAVALAHPNIAFIKYWGNRDHNLHLPSNGSISMTLGGLDTLTKIVFDSSFSEDKLILNENNVSGSSLDRVSSQLDIIRTMAKLPLKAEVISQSNFPISAGIASSASGFAALTVAAAAAAGLDLNPTQLSRIARVGSGSACRSIFSGYVEWKVGTNDADSVAEMIADQDHWDLIDNIAIVEEGHKSVGSSSGHRFAESSPLQNVRIQDTERRLRICRDAILHKDFSALATIVEEDCYLMHAIMMTSRPPLLYWRPETVTIMKSIYEWRNSGVPVCFTIDAGPNVHCLCPSAYEEKIRGLLAQIPNVTNVIRSTPGGGAHLLPA